MTETQQLVQQRITALRAKGWTLASISAELGVNWKTVQRWERGERFPENARPVLAMLDSLLQRADVPKQRRYRGTHHLQRAKRARGEDDT